MNDTKSQTDSEFTWTAHPASEQPGRAVLAVLLVLAVAAAVWLSVQSVAWGVVAVIVLVAALNRFFFPSRFIITEEGIAASYPLMRKHAQWRYLRRFLYDDHGGYLATRARPSRLDAYRGMHLLFGTQREAAINRIEAHMARAGAATSRTGTEVEVSTGKAAA